MCRAEAQMIGVYLYSMTLWRAMGRAQAPESIKRFKHTGTKRFKHTGTWVRGYFLVSFRPKLLSLSFSLSLSFLSQIILPAPRFLSLYHSSLKSFSLRQDSHLTDAQESKETHYKAKREHHLADCSDSLCSGNKPGPQL
jgi:hypothetical protein